MLSRLVYLWFCFTSRFLFKPLQKNKTSPRRTFYFLFNFFFFHINLFVLPGGPSFFVNNFVLYLSHEKCCTIDKDSCSYKQHLTTTTYHHFLAKTQQPQKCWRCFFSEITKPTKCCHICDRDSGFRRQNETQRTVDRCLTGDTCQANTSKVKSEVKKIVC